MSRKAITVTVLGVVALAIGITVCRGCGSESPPEAPRNGDAHGPVSDVQHDLAAEQDRIKREIELLRAKSENTGKEKQALDSLGAKLRLLQSQLEAMQSHASTAAELLAKREQDFKAYLDALERKWSDQQGKTPPPPSPPPPHVPSQPPNFEDDNTANDWASKALAGWLSTMGAAAGPWGMIIGALLGGLFGGGDPETRKAIADVVTDLAAGRAPSREAIDKIVTYAKGREDKDLAAAIDRIRKIYDRLPEATKNSVAPLLTLGVSDDTLSDAAKSIIQAMKSRVALAQVMSLLTQTEDGPRWANENDRAVVEILCRADAELERLYWSPANGLGSVQTKR